jgi:hypothetical protein
VGRASAILLGGFLAFGHAAQAQTRWTIDPKLSLAWWQVDPHLSHLWATTCPQEPSWRPGEARSAGWSVGKGFPPLPDGNISDTIRVPRFPRYEALPVCPDAVEGQVVVADRARWAGVRGLVKVRADALVTGNDERDGYARQAVLQTGRYPDVRFAIDSVVIEKRTADTLSGTARGVLTLREVQQPAVALIRAWPEAGGLRVLARLRIPADSLVPVYGFSKVALGLGVGTKIWRNLFFGVDVVLLADSTARD